MRSQNMQGGGQGDWDRNRNEMDSRTGAGNPDYGRPNQHSAPSNYPESRYQYQAQQDHPGSEYFSGSTGYGGRDDFSRQQQGQGGFGQQQNYGGGSWSRSEAEFRGQGMNRQQEAYQPGSRQQGYGSEDFGRGGYGGYGREEQGHQFGGQFGAGQQHHQSQNSQFGRGDFEEQPFSGRGQQQYQQGAGGNAQPAHTPGIREYRSGQGHIGQHGDQDYGGQQSGQFQTYGGQMGQGYYGGGHEQQSQFHGYGGQMSGQSYAGQASRFGGHYPEHQQQGYGGFQGGQPMDYGNQQGGQFFNRGSHESSQQPSGGYGAYGAYQVGSQPQHLGRGPRAPKDYTRSDERIRELICEHLAHHPSIDASDVSVQVKEGKVTLDGTVPERRMKHEIEDVADGCWGVKDVENRVRVQSGQSGLHGEQHGQKTNLDSPAQGWLAVPADVLTGGASTQAAQGKTSATDMSPIETSGSGMSTANLGSSETNATKASAGTESKRTDK